MSTPSFSLGAKLRELRKERDFTQRNLADKAGVSVNAISLIERDQISPSVSTLQSLARAFNIKMSYFFAEDPPAEIIFVKAANRPVVDGQSMRISGLGSKLSGQQMNPFFLTLSPHADSGPQPVVHNGHEFIYCLNGVITCRIDNNFYEMESGDSLLFEASLPHSWQNLTDRPAELLFVIQVLDEPEESTRRHFPDYPSLPHLG
jgi:transcriptional regulator with XRE-family HTH domain